MQMGDSIRRQKKRRSALAVFFCPDGNSALKLIHTFPGLWRALSPPEVFMPSCGPGGATGTGPRPAAVRHGSAPRSFQPALAGLRVCPTIRLNSYRGQNTSFAAVLAMASRFPLQARAVRSSSECLSLGLNAMAVVQGEGGRQGWFKRMLSSCCGSCGDDGCDCCCEGCGDCACDGCRSSCDCG
jgi:hypothetical protein